MLNALLLLNEAKSKDHMYGKEQVHQKATHIDLKINALSNKVVAASKELHKTYNFQYIVHF